MSEDILAFFVFYPAFYHTPLWCINLPGRCSAVLSLLKSHFKVQQKKYTYPDRSERKLTRAAVEYTRGLPVVKSFGMEGASFSAFRKACVEARKIALRIEWGFIPFKLLTPACVKVGQYRYDYFCHGSRTLRSSFPCQWFLYSPYFH